MHANPCETVLKFQWWCHQKVDDVITSDALWEINMAAMNGGILKEVLEN